MKINIGQKIRTLAGLATVTETNDAGVKIKHLMPNGLGQEEWLSYGQAFNRLLCEGQKNTESNQHGKVKR